MAKQTSKSNSKSKTKSSFTQKVNSSNSGRPKPMTTKAGYTQTRRRYENGGKWCW